MKRLSFIFLIVIVFLFLISCTKLEEKTPSTGNIECIADSDCVKDSCCHAKSCVAKDKAPDCKGIMCTMECSPNTLDCGQGSCKCVNNKCEAIYS